MANRDNPRGLWAYGHLTGGQINTRPYTAGGTIYKGDPVKAINDGTVTVIAAGDTILGVAANYATSGQTVQVYDDPFITFGIQCTTGQTPTAADIFGTADMIAYAAGNATTKLSIMELAAISTGSANFKVLGLIDSPDNTWGEHADVEVLIHEHFFTSYTTAADAATNLNAGI